MPKERYLETLRALAECNHATIVQLTAKGRRAFERVIHADVAYRKRGFPVLDAAELDPLDRLLGRLRAGLR
jgi:DNA-binding MarR family transcriptional regulator